MITIEEGIAVPAAPERVWAVVSDPAQVVSCISGAELGESHDDGSFDGTLVVRFGAIRVRFGARLTLDLDETGREGRLAARGRDGQGATRFAAAATFHVVADPATGGSRVRMSGEVSLTGKLASVIESGAGAVVSRMTKDFAAALVSRCADDRAAEPPAAPRSWWATVRDWWQRIVHKRQAKRVGSAR